MTVSDFLALVTDRSSNFPLLDEYSYDQVRVYEETRSSFFFLYLSVSFPSDYVRERKIRCDI